MRLGATLAHWAAGPQFPAGPEIPVAEWARRLVAAGFESLWTPEIIGRGALVPDPFVALAAAAVATDGVELGTATLQLPLHHPAELAHRVLSLVALCGDRLTLGVSPGSTAADFAALDRDYGERFATFGRHVDRLRVLLAEGRDDGAQLAPSGNGPGVPPLLLGSWGANVERAARGFDGWLASGYRRTTDQILAAHDRYRAAGGRRAIVCAIPVPDRAAFDSTATDLERYRRAGFDDAVVVLVPGGPEPEEVRALV